MRIGCIHQYRKHQATNRYGDVLYTFKACKHCGCVKETGMLNFFWKCVEVVVVAFILVVAAVCFGLGVSSLVGYLQPFVL